MFRPAHFPSPPTLSPPSPQQNSVVIVDLASPTVPVRRPITADSAIMAPASAKRIALKASVAGAAGDSLQVFDLDSKAKVASFQIADPVVYWKWTSATELGLVTATAVYKWVVGDGNTPASDPVKVFGRAPALEATQIISYRTTPDGKWAALVGIAPGAADRPALVRGVLQLWSGDARRSQVLDAHAAAFAAVTPPGAAAPVPVIVFAQKTAAASKLHIVQLGAPPGTPALKKAAELFFPPEYADDFPVALHVSDKYGLAYVVTKLGLLFVYDATSGAAVYRNRVSADPVFLATPCASSGGVFVINRRGQVLHATVDEAALVPFVAGQLKNVELALALAQRGNLPGADALVGANFDRLFAAGDFKAASVAAADSPNGALRTPATMDRFKSVPAPSGQPSPLLVYFGTLLQRGGLNAPESVELARLVLAQGKKHLLDAWLKDGKLTPSEALGDALKGAGDADAALGVYKAAGATSKVIEALASKGDFASLAAVASASGEKPDYMALLQRLMMDNGDAAVSLAKAVIKQPGSGVEVGAVADLFLQRNMVREATAFLLDALAEDKPEHDKLQTKVGEREGWGGERGETKRKQKKKRSLSSSQPSQLLEINLVTNPQVADAILASGQLTHYDRPRIAQLAEKAGLYMRALQHYTDLADIRRAVVNTHALDPAALVEFFGSLSAEWALDCLKELLVSNPQQNLALVVQIAKEYTEQIGAARVVKLFEDHGSAAGLYLYLGSYVAFSQDPDVHFKYIEAAAKTGNVKEVERATRESDYYPPERTKAFLMDAKLPDARPLINVCDRHGMVGDLTAYLHANGMARYIEAYVQKVNPSQAPAVVGALLDAGAPDDYVTGLILSVRSLVPVDKLCDEVETRGRLKLLTLFLEQLVAEGSHDPGVHSALGKTVVDAGANAEHFLTTNPYYDSVVVGKHCEKRDPHLACVAYRRGQCDAELVACTAKHSLFKVQARYVVERADADLWATVLDEGNAGRRALVDQVRVERGRERERARAAVVFFFVFLTLSPTPPSGRLHRPARVPQPGASLRRGQSLHGGGAAVGVDRAARKDRPPKLVLRQQPQPAEPAHHHRHQGGQSPRRGLRGAAGQL